MSNKPSRKIYSSKDIEIARQAMVEKLASLSNGVLLAGCCTQGCCDEQAQETTIKGFFKQQPPIKRYTKEHIQIAKAAMLEKLAEFSGGGMIAGCCTQNCCDPSGQLEMLILLP